MRRRQCVPEGVEGKPAFRIGVIKRQLLRGQIMKRL